MTTQLMHMDALSRKIRSVKVIKQANPWFLLVELPDGSEAYIYFSETLKMKIVRHVKESGSKNGIQGIELHPVKTHSSNGIEFAVWEIVRPPSQLPPKYILKDEN